MSEDDRAIRDVVAIWMRASKAGDVQTVLNLMTDDVIFMTPGRPPFGKEAFATGSASMKDIEFDGTTDVLEVQVFGDWAYLRNHIEVTMTPKGGAPVRRSGYTLSVMRREPDGRWRLARDANLVA